MFKKLTFVTSLAESQQQQSQRKIAESVRATKTKMAAINTETEQQQRNSEKFYFIQKIFN